MASEKLVVPEENLLEVVAVIEAGLRGVKKIRISTETKEQLRKWCKDMTKYMEPKDG